MNSFVANIKGFIIFFSLNIIKKLVAIVLSFQRKNKYDKSVWILLSCGKLLPNLKTAVKLYFMHISQNKCFYFFILIDVDFQSAIKIVRMALVFKL